MEDDTYVIANVGRLHRDNDQATLLRCFAQALPELPANTLLLILLGKGPLEQELKALARELGIAGKVLFAGQVPEARRYFSAFDTFVLTSDHEPFGMVLLEAMAAELPIICSDTGGGPEAVNGSGLTFHHQDPIMLKHTILTAHEQRLDIDRKRILNILRDNFSDDAGRKVFWSLEWINKVVRNAAMALSLFVWGWASELDRTASYLSWI